MTQWKVGMKAVHIPTPNSVVFTVIGVKSKRCSCGVLVALMFAGIDRPTQCECGKPNGGSWWDARYYRPVDDLLESLDRIAEEVERDGVPLEEPELETAEV